MTNATCGFIEHIRASDNAIGKRPVYQTNESACADVELPYTVTIPAQSAVKVDLLLSLDIPYGHQVIMFPRSSLLIKYNLIQPTSVIDSDYKEHIHAPLYNPTSRDIVLEKGTRIAQIELLPVFNVTNWPRLKAERTGGFGSTGK